MKTIIHIKPSSIEIDSDNDRVRIVGYPEYDDLCGHFLGNGMAMLRRGRYEIFLLNTSTGLMRQFVDREEKLLVKDTEVNDRQIRGHLSHGYSWLDNRIASFGGLHTWGGFKNGFCALDWTLYPDGRYFADEGGFGMEDNDEEVVYCIINKNLDIVVPFYDNLLYQHKSHDFHFSWHYLSFPLLPALPDKIQSAYDALKYCLPSQDGMYQALHEALHWQS